jgi:PAS domain S-box-containing protein
MKPGLRPIKFWLILLVLACVLPAWTISVFLIVRSYQHDRGVITANTVVIARALMQAVDGNLQAVEAALRTLATSPSLAAGDLAAFHARGLEVTRTLDAVSMVLLEPSGQQLLNTLVPFGTPLPRDGNPESLARLFETGRPVISDLFVGPVAGQPMIAVTVPVVRGETTTRGLAMGILPERFAEIVNQRHPPSDWVVTIFDTTGTIVARNRGAGQFVGKKGSVRFFRRITEVPEDVIEGRNLDGAPSIAAFSHSAYSGWSVAIGVPTATVAAELRHSLWLSLGFTGTLLLLGAVTAHAIGNRIVRSIRALSEPALALASGATLSIPPTEIEEVAEVGAALVEASRRLARRQADEAVIAAAERQAAVADRVTARLRGLLEATPDALILARRDGTIDFANSQAETVFGYARRELHGQPVGLLIPSRFRADHRRNVSAFFGATGVRQMGGAVALFGKHKDGTEFPVEVSLSPVEIDGETSVLAAVRDVSERKRLEAIVETSRMQMIASARLSALGEMAGGIAHEINNPLAVIYGLSSDLAESAEQGEVTAGEVGLVSRQIEQYAERIAKIIKSLRYIARDGARDPFEEVAAAVIVEQVLNLCAQRFKGGAVALGVVPVDPAIWLACRQVQIAQVLTNLLQNAYDATRGLPGEKWVRLEVARVADTVVMSVIDRGHGVPSELKTRIMDPFFTTKPVGEGTGLGLSLSKRIAEDHGGVLEVTERDGHTCFSLHLPIAGPSGASCD